MAPELGKLKPAYALPSFLEWILFQFNEKGGKGKRDAKSVVNLSLHVFCVVAHQLTITEIT